MVFRVISIGCRIGIGDQSAAWMDTLMGCVGFPAIAPTEAERRVADKAGIKPGPTEQNAELGSRGREAFPRVIVPEGKPASPEQITRKGGEVFCGRRECRLERRSGVGAKRWSAPCNYPPVACCGLWRECQLLASALCL